MSEGINKIDLIKQLEDVRLQKKIEYYKKIEKEQVKQQSVKIEIKEYLDKSINKSYEECVIQKNEQEPLEECVEVEIKEYQKYLDRTCSINKSYEECMIQQNEDTDIILVYSIFEDFDTRILNKFYQKVNNTESDNLYTFYVCIKEISSTYDNINIELIINTLDLIKIDNQFVYILNKLNKLEYIKIIFQEFIKIINQIKPELN